MTDKLTEEQVKKLNRLQELEDIEITLTGEGLDWAPYSVHHSKQYLEDSIKELDRKKEAVEIQQSRVFKNAEELRLVKHKLGGVLEEKKLLKQSLGL